MNTMYGINKIFPLPVQEDTVTGMESKKERSQDATMDDHIDQEGIRKKVSKQVFATGKHAERTSVPLEEGITNNKKEKTKTRTGEAKFTLQSLTKKNNHKEETIQTP